MTQPQTDKLDDHHRQQLSAMLDGELLPDQAKFMLRRLEHDGELAACWERWQVCGEVMRGRQGALLPADFSRRVADAIVGQRDVAPAAGAATAPKHPRWARWGGGAALAASVAMAALFVGRQAPAPGPETTAPAQVVASRAAPGADAPAMPSPEPVMPAAPTQAPDVASTLATAVAAAEVPRRAAQRRASRGQQQRAASRVRRDSQAPVTVAVAAAGASTASSPLATDALPAPVALAEADSPASSTVSELFTTQPMQPRPWPRAILPGLPARDAFTVGYGGMAQEHPQERHPFHPFEPRVELPPAQVEPQPTASGPR